MVRTSPFKILSWRVQTLNQYIRRVPQTVNLLTYLWLVYETEPLVRFCGQVLFRRAIPTVISYYTRLSLRIRPTHTLPPATFPFHNRFSLLWWFTAIKYLTSSIFTVLAYLRLYRLNLQVMGTIDTRKLLYGSMNTSP
ncbi:hypothetical protein J6590_048930 [Homalodisca vitripennis]|nr:hypothetical protein J6590_048930 [Homalodisca vitripennis]